MIFVNIRNVFLTLMFVIGAATLFFGYMGVAGPLLSGKPADSADTISSGKENAGFEDVKNEPVQGIISNSVKNEKEAFFVEYRLEREKSRSRQIEILREIVNNPSSSSETRKSAQDQLMAISKSISKEVRVENLLRAKGYKDAVACIDTRGVTVVLESGGMNSTEEARVIEMVSKETGFGEQGIIIIPKK
ncbi:MAG: SpoIIIAH-like family protein [Bacillota bacterium]